MFSSTLNITRLNSSHENNSIIQHTSSLTIIQRIIIILSIILLFWIVFILIYLITRLIILNLKRWNLSVNKKICQVFVISPNQCGSFRPIQTLNRSDSLFSNINFALTNEKMNSISNSNKIHLIENYEYQQSKTSLLEHYLKTYNPLQIDLHQETISTSNVKTISNDSETDTHTNDNCYPLHCTNKQNLYQIRRYTRLKEQENCSATISLVDERLSECSTKLTSTTVPIVMVTDCSNSQRLHTDIIEMNEEE